MLVENFKRMALFGCAGLVVMVSGIPARAVPAFARKYGTSCQTCHIAYPKLNAFGEAFRVLGYRMPGETEDQVKQPDVPLGAEGYKKIWPKSVWPGAITSHVPLSVVGDFLWRNASSLEEPEHEEEMGGGGGSGGMGEEGMEQELVHTKVQNDFVFPEEVAIVAAGTTGDHIAYFGEIGFEQEVEDGERHGEASVEHLDLRFISPIKNSPAFNVKVGAFQPELVSTFDHARRLTITNYDSMFAVGTASPGGAEGVGGGHHGGGGSLALPAIARGIELFGVAGHRFLWCAGVVNGLEPGHDTFDANNRKDVYARVAYKLGGLAPDGSNADTYAGTEKNWRERSLRIGVFAYGGNGSDAFSQSMHDGEVHYVEDRSYSRFGIDLNWFMDDLNVLAGYVKGTDDLRVYEPDELGEGPGELKPEDSGSFDYTSWFLEADAVLGVPWLVGIVRYESVDLPNEEARRWERGVLSANALIRANVKATLEYVRDLNESQNYEALVRLGFAF